MVKPSTLYKSIAPKNLCISHVNNLDSRAIYGLCCTVQCTPPFPFLRSLPVKLTLYELES